MRLRRVVPLTFAFMAWAGCYKWTPVPGTASSLEAGGKRDTLRITPREGRPVRLRAVTLAGDSLVGIDVWDNQRYAIATSQIKTLEVRQLGKGETLGATLGAIVAIGGIVIGLSLAALSSAPL